MKKPIVILAVLVIGFMSMTFVFAVPRIYHCPVGSQDNPVSCRDGGQEIFINAIDPQILFKQASSFEFSCHLRQQGSRYGVEVFNFVCVPRAQEGQSFNLTTLDNNPFGHSFTVDIKDHKLKISGVK